MLVVPDSIERDTTAWLDRVDAGLAGIRSALEGHDPDVNVRFEPAVQDVHDRTARLRAVLAGSAGVDQLVESRWVPVGRVDRSTAERICSYVIQAAEVPDSVVDGAHERLVDVQLRRLFLRQVGDVASAAFVNFGWGLWEQYPDLFPSGWVASSTDSARPSE